MCCGFYSSELDSNKKMSEQEKKKIEELTRERDILSKVRYSDGAEFFTYLF
jgi:hypothetical protein